MSRSAAQAIADARSTREAEAALKAQRAEIGEAAYVAGMRRLLGPERYVDWLEGYALGGGGGDEPRRGGAGKGQQMAAVKKQAASVGTLKFRGRLLKVDAKAPTIKRAGYYGQEELSGGSLVLQIQVERPQLPKAPSVPYEVQRGRPDDPGAEPAWVEPEAVEGEKAADRKKRVAAARRTFEVEHSRWQAAVNRVRTYQEAVEKHQAEVRRHEARVASLQDELRDYGTLVLAGGLMSGLEFAATLRPSQTQVRKFLPGFVPEAALLALRPATAAEEPASLDDPDDDDADLGDSVGDVVSDAELAAMLPASLDEPDEDDDFEDDAEQEAAG